MPQKGGCASHTCALVSVPFQLHWRCTEPTSPQMYLFDPTNASAVSTRGARPAMHCGSVVM